MEKLLRIMAMAAQAVGRAETGGTRPGSEPRHAEKETGW